MKKIFKTDSFYYLDINNRTCTIICSKFNAYTITTRTYPGGSDKLTGQARKVVQTLPNSPVSSSMTHNTTSNVDLTTGRDINSTVSRPLDNTNDAKENLAPIVSKIPSKSLEFNSILDQVSKKESSENNNYIEQRYFLNIVQYNYTGQLKLTPEAQNIYTTQLKSKLLLDFNNSDLPKEGFVSDNDTYESTQDTKSELIVGIVNVHPETEILSAIQQHLVVGKVDPETDTITVGAFFTSEKGMKSGISGYNTTTKVSDTKEISEMKGGQFATVVYPPITVKSADFTEHDQGTAYANKPDVNIILNDLITQSLRYQAEPFDGKGVTQSDLENVAELMPFYTKTTADETED